MSKKYKIKFDKLPTQAKVFDDLKTKIIVQSMGLGGGKTYNLCMKAIQLSQLNKNIAGGILAPTYRDFKRDILPTMEDILEEARIPYKYHRTDHYFMFPWSKKPVYVFSAEKPIAGPNLGFCLVNEFSLITWVRINEMLRRVRVKNAPAPQRILVGTPEDVHGWLEEFIDAQMGIEEKKPNSFKLHQGTSSENIHIDEDYTALLESMLDEKSLKVFRDGEIGRIGGEFFYYSYSKELVSDVNAVRNHDKHIYCGLDFNFGRMCMSFSHQYGDEQHFFDEKMLLGDSNTVTAGEYIVKTYGTENLTIICDTSGKNRSSASRKGLHSDVAILRDMGLTVKYKTANPRLRKRQLQMNSMIEKQKIRVHPDCKNILKDFSKTKQKADYTKDEGKGHQFSHFSDGCDYIIDWLHEWALDKRRKTTSFRL